MNQQSTALLNDIARLRNQLAMPQDDLSKLDKVVRYYDQPTADQLATFATRLAGLRDVGQAAEELVSHCEVRIAGRLRSYAQVAYNEGDMNSPDGRAAIVARIKDEAESQQGALDAARIADEQQEARRRDAELHDRAMGTAPEELLNKLSAAGVDVSIDDSGAILISPPGRLDILARKVIELRRAEIASLLTARRQVEVI